MAISDDLPAKLRRLLPRANPPILDDMETVFFYARCVDEIWEAICLDFDIAVQGPSFEAVRTSLMSAVRTYVEDAEKEKPADRDRLLARRAPWPLRARIALDLAGSALARHHSSSRKFQAGSAPCRA